jgi:hypothetical protein
VTRDVTRRPPELPGISWLQRSPWLSEYFGPPVTTPIRPHVAAKRYLCGTDSEYIGRLSRASLDSLARQGGRYLSYRGRMGRAMRGQVREC